MHEHMLLYLLEKRVHVARAALVLQPHETAALRPLGVEAALVPPPVPQRGQHSSNKQVHLTRQTTNRLRDNKSYSTMESSRPVFIELYMPPTRTITKDPYPNIWTTSTRGL